MTSFSEAAAQQQNLLTIAKDSGGGFLVGDDHKKRSDAECSNAKRVRSDDDQEKSESSSEVVLKKCMVCGGKMVERSFLQNHFDYDVCDGCRDERGKHGLVTRTEAKNVYLLKDCDLDSREPPLRFILKKNPHEKYSKHDMKLYLRVQVEERALLVWGTKDAIEEERQNRCGKRKVRKQKEYQKQLKELRMSVQSSLFTKNLDDDSQDRHHHVFSSPEVCVDEDNDLYQKTCNSCGYIQTFEKM